MADFPLLNTINSPADLRQLHTDELKTLADELRGFLIHTLNQCGGHFGANLGAVELTIALHYLFNTPTDALIWDVGHQAYPHKVLTGRRDQLPSIKQPGGLAPFPSRYESEYDAFGVGHSSTSISAAVGMAMAAKIDGSERQSVAIIGDGGLTGGMAFEALNHAGSIDANVLVILNDNEMSISPNVGALTNYLARIMSSKMYTNLREGGKKVLDIMPPMKNLVKKTETHLKGMVTPGTLFEELGFHYFGPIDGHDLDALLPTLTNIKAINGPRLLHVVTTKGKGYAPAEEDQVKYHAVNPGFDNPPESSPSNKTSPLTYSNLFGDWLCDIATKEPNMIAITPAMREGSGMVRFAEQFPAQYCDVGIAEQHSVTLAAGLACANKKPIVAIYSTFLQRGYDQLIHDVALQHCDVLFALDRAGLVGSDGPTHAGSFDYSFCRCIPNMVVMAPSDENECWQMLNTGYHYPGPATVRYPRGCGPGTTITDNTQTLPIGKAKIERQGKTIAILAFGSMVHPALDAAERLNASVVNMRFVKPIDKDIIQTMAKSHHLIVTIEENTIMGGAGSAITEILHQQHHQNPVLQLGLPDSFIEHGKPSEMLAECGLDAAGIVKSIQEKMAALSLLDEATTTAL
ncbi:MAG: 1-deoxy-D-xylulose-5-phosphate synthase [Coxiellaceae bacterium]|nr:1-deoxy-D-xylulose-5-phosphate synthase [Coxiellaceae bacterium]